MRSPIQYLGGKGNLVKQLLPLVPVHRQYVEPFFGGGSMYFAKKPCGHETINDLNGDVINFYRVLQSPEGLAELQRLLELTPYSRQVYYDAREELETATDPLRRAYLFFVIARMCMGGIFGSGWGYTVTTISRNRPCTINSFRMATDCLTEVHERLRKRPTGRRQGERKTTSNRSRLVQLRDGAERTRKWDVDKLGIKVVRKINDRYSSNPVFDNEQFKSSYHVELISYFYEKVKLKIGATAKPHKH